MLLEARQAGAILDLDSIPGPSGVALEQWLIAFPAFAFLLCAEPDRVEACREWFTQRDLTCERIGEVTNTGELIVTHRGKSEAIVSFQEDHLTGIPPL